MNRGIVRVYILGPQAVKYVKEYDKNTMMPRGQFMDFNLDKHIPVRIHVPDFCMEINIDTSGVHVVHRQRELLATE